MSKITNVTRSWANCECCWTYDFRVIDCDCWHQIIEWDELKIWEEIECEECEECEE